MKTWIERAVSLMLGLSAVAIATSVVHRQFWPQATAGGSGPQGMNPTLPPTYVREAADVARSAGIRVGSPNAKVEIIEFADFECPFCGTYDKVLDDFARRYGDTVAVTFVHYPLSIHRFAKRAAQTAECANDQGRFAQMKSILYAHQDSFSANRWLEMGKDAGVPDLKLFEACLRRPIESFARIDSGLAWAQRLTVRGTPTVLINGWQYAGGPPDSALASAVTAILDGKNPRNAKK